MYDGMPTQREITRTHLQVAVRILCLADSVPCLHATCAHCCIPAGWGIVLRAMTVDHFIITYIWVFNCFCLLCSRNSRETTFRSFALPPSQIKLALLVPAQEGLRVLFQLIPAAWHCGWDGIAAEEVRVPGNRPEMVWMRGTTVLLQEPLAQALCVPFCSENLWNRQIRLHSKGSRVRVRKFKSIAHVLYLKNSSRVEIILGPWELPSRCMSRVCKMVGNETCSHERQSLMWRMDAPGT